eukprot:COSAG01_NODE_1807_length_9189_cov_24.677778_9_plen_90_part_00
MVEAMRPGICMHSDLINGRDSQFSEHMCVGLQHNVATTSTAARCWRRHCVRPPERCTQTMHCSTTHAVRSLHSVPGIGLSHLFLTLYQH